jgi:hypothetical protein
MTRSRSDARETAPPRNSDPDLRVGPIRIPIGAILADPAEQAGNNSYLPPVFYQDMDFECRDCGRAETWTAEQQHWWYEVAKGPVDSTAVRCRPCRQRRREAQGKG